MLMNAPSGGDSFQATDGSLVTGANGSAVVTVPSSATRQALQRGWSVYSPQYSSAPPDALTLAQLQINTPASSVLPGSAQAFYYTSDQGLVYSNGAYWVGATGNLFPPRVISPYSPISVSAIGDSIVVAMMYGFGDLNGGSAAAMYATESRVHTDKSWLLYGAMRSGMAWRAHEYTFGYSGATSATILASCLPALLGLATTSIYPAAAVGLPQMCVILAGTNDWNQSVALATTLSNIKQMAVALLSAGIVPVLCSVPPIAATYTAAQAAACEMIALGVCRLAQELNVPFADFYSALVNPANGQYANQVTGNPQSKLYNIGLDNIHPGPLGAAIMGYVLNQTILGWTRAQPRVMPFLSDQSTLSNQSRYPGFTTLGGGSINVSGSYPSGWAAGATTTATSTVFNSSGTEPGTGLTMAATVPQIGGVAVAQNYLGNSWALSGVGTSTGYYNGAIALPNLNAGDRLALRARIKWAPDMTQTTPGNFMLGLADISTGFDPCCGIVGQAFYNTQTNGQTGPIGNETAYPAGDLYLEYTLGPSSPPPTTNFLLYVILCNSTSFVAGDVNTGDALVLANLSVTNLTQNAILEP